MGWWSLRTAIPLSIALSTVIASAYTFHTEGRLALGNVDSEAVETLRRTMARSQESLEHALHSHEVEWMRSIVASLASNRDRELAILIDNGGKVIAATRLAAIGHSTREVFPPMTAREEDALQRRLRRAQESLAGSVRISPDGKNIEAIYPVQYSGNYSDLRPRDTHFLLVREDLSRRKKVALAAVGRQIARLATVLVLLSATLWMFLHLAVNRRIRRLVATTEQVGGGNLDARADLTSRDELGELAAALNRMISERQQAEHKLRESDKRFSLMVAGSNDGYADWPDVNMDRQWWSPRMLEMLGYRPGEIEPSASLLNKLIHPEDKPRIRDAVSQFFDNRGPYEIEYRIRTTAGDYRWFLVRAAAVRDASGRPLRVSGSFHDITVRKQAEEENSRLVAAVEGVAELVIITDGDAVVRYVNRAFERSTGYTAAEVVGRRPPLLRSDRHDDKFYTELWQTVSSGRVWRGSIFNRMKDGTVIEHETVISPLRNEHGKIVSVVAVERDISERRAAEAEIRKLNEELEQRVEQRTAALKAANADLESFAYSVSHDLRTPLRGINAYSTVLLEDYGDKLDAAGADSLRRLRAASQKMAMLIDDILTLSRVSRGELDFKPIDLSEMCYSIIEELERGDPVRKVHWTVAPGLSINGDARLMRAVMTNLLGNAWKFSSPREHAEIEVGCDSSAGDSSAGDGSDASGPESTEMRVYFVRDNGVGFDGDYAHKMFGAFQRLHKAEEFPGTGIGLATVERIIRRHGGRVWAKGEIDRGATVYFTVASSSSEASSNAA